MNRRRTPNIGKRHNDSRQQSHPPADNSANSHRPDKTNMSSYGVFLGHTDGMQNSGIMPISGAQKLFDCMPAAEDPNGRNCQVFDVKHLSADVGDLTLMHHSQVERDGSKCLESSGSNFKKDIDFPSARFNPKDKPKKVWRQRGVQTECIEEDSQRSLHFNTSCIVNCEHMDESSQPINFISEDRLLEPGIQSRKSSGEKIGFKDESKSSHYLYDICPQGNGHIVKLKAPLHVRNREVRNENKRNVEGHSILVLRPGMVILKGYISFNEQVKLVKTCRELGLGPGGFYQPGFLDGAKLNLKMMCLGKNWDPEASAYGDERPSDGAKPPIIPHEFSQLVKRSINHTHVHLGEQCRNRNVEGILPPMSPNICIVNFYSKSGKLGLHQDKDETQESLHKGLPVVSFSIGDSAEFLYGDERDVSKVEKVILESGDVLIFGGKSRHIYHGVASIYPDTAPKALLEETNLRPGRLNLTFREY